MINAESRGDSPLISVLIPSYQCAEILPSTVRAWVDAFKRWGIQRSDWEVVLAPNPAPSLAPHLQDSRLYETERVCKMLAEAGAFQNIRCVPCSEAGKGAALAQAFAESRGEIVFFSDSDQPYDLSFFEEAYRVLRHDGMSLVTGNRRLPDSRFELPMAVLPYTYVRHLLGLTFNRVVRAVFPSIRTRDTQAGAKAMTRVLAEAFFRNRTCPSYFFDLELFLTATQGGFKWGERPVTLRLLKEESSIRFMREARETVRWIAKIRWNAWRGHYRVKAQANGPHPTLPTPAIDDARAREETAGVREPDVSGALPREVSPAESPSP